jgi:DNA polymerase-3 subunit gamma/tau
VETPTRFADLVARLRAHGYAPLAGWLVEGVHLVRLEPGLLELRPRPGVPRELPGELASALRTVTGRRWMVALSEAPGEPTLAEQAAAARARRIEELGRTGPIRNLLELFPGAEIVDVRPAAPAGARGAAEEEHGR